MSVSPLASQYKALHPDSRLNSAKSWIKKYRAVSLQTAKTVGVPEDMLSVHIREPHDAKGLYFHPLLVASVLKWMSPELEQEVRTAYTGAVSLRGLLKLSGGLEE